PDAQLYIGADDNLDNGEHDGVNPTVYGSAPVANGPSDGGATQVNVHPQGDPRHPASIGQNVAPRDGHNPVRAADAAMGACADGLCFAVETRRRLAYHGGCYNGTSCPDRNVYSDDSRTNWRNQD